MPSVKQTNKSETQPLSSHFNFMVNQSVCVYGLIFHNPKEEDTLNKKTQEIFTTEFHLSFQSLLLLVSILTEHTVTYVFMLKYLSSSYFVGIWTSENLPSLYLLLSPCRNEDKYKSMKIH